MFKVFRLGCAALLHQRDTVDSLKPNCPANHLPVFFFYTNTTFMQFKSLFIVDLLILNANILQNNKNKEENDIPLC